MTDDANYTAEDARSDSYRRPAHEDCRSDLGCPGCEAEQANADLACEECGTFSDLKQCRRCETQLCSECFDEAFCQSDHVRHGVA